MGARPAPPVRPRPPTWSSSAPWCRPRPGSWPTCPAQPRLQERIYLLPALLVLVFVLKGIFTYSGTLLMVRSGIRATIALRERLFGHLLKQEPAFFQRHPVGELLQRCISDVGAVQGIASNQLADAVREITQALAMLAYVMSSTGG